MKRLICLLFSLLVVVSPSLAQEPKADLVVLNGNVYTGDKAVGRVEALAVAGGKIVAAGSSEDIQSRIGPETRVIDLEGKFVMPGFNDAHVHIWLASQQLMNVDAEGTTSIAEFQQRIRKHIQTREPGSWVLGGGWDQSLWQENRMPTRADLDAVSTDFLMALSRVDGHSIIVNTPVLTKAGITRDTKDPEGGQIVRDEQGEPTGWIKDRAVDLVMGLVPEETREQRKQGILKVLALARRLGVTSIQDDSIRFDNIESFRALQELKKAGKLTARINVMLPFEYPLDDLIKLRDEIGTDDPWLRTGLLKTETDGSGGSLSAAMYEPFANAPGNSGYMKIEPGMLEEMILERDAAGFQIALHAIGDRANRIVLDGFEKARKVNGRTNARHRIEHVQYIQDADLKRFQELGVIASMQPVHLLAEIRWTKTLLGAEREYQAYRVRSLLDAGAQLALGTDYPVELLPPLRGLYAAVAREFEAGGPEGGYQPQEKIGIEEALQAYTVGAAYAEFQEQHKGTLVPGMLADFIVLSNDLTQIPPAEILATQILMTVVDGKVVMLAAQQPPADTVLLNGTIYTGDEKIGRVEAVAIIDGKIAAAGLTEEIQDWVGPNTKEIDLQGRFVMSGFNDGHVHFANGGRSLLSVNVEGARSLGEFAQRIRDRLGDFPPGEWVAGRGWDHSLWKENRIPTRADLDAISTEHPMIFTRVDGHSAVANSLALEMAGITGETESPQGGAIVLDDDGVPTGWLKETAQGLVYRLIPGVTREQRKQGLLLALEDAARNGITSIHDNSAWEDFLVMRELKEEGNLTLRVTEWLPFDAPLEELKRMRQEGGTTDPWLKTGALKGVTDGSGGSLSAAMLEPFSNAPDNRGLLRKDPETWKKMAAARDFDNFQIALHAIGDRANRVSLDSFEAARKINKRKNARHRVEHSQFVHRDDMPRFKELEVIASAQPAHLLSDLRWAPTILGPAREYEAYAWNSLQKLGVVLAFGTDYPVEPLNPFRGLFAAVAREFEDGSGPEGGWRPEEKISIEEAIRAYTLGSAYAEFEELRKGTLSPGKFADLIVLSQDITAVPASDILTTKVLLTMVGGKVVYRQEEE